MRITLILAFVSLVASDLIAIPQNLLWPRPQSLSFGTWARSVNPSTVNVNINGGNRELLLKFAVDRLKTNVLLMGCSDITNLPGDINTIDVTILETDPFDFSNAKESYTLNSTNSTVYITAAHSVGALRAFETLSQLISPKAVAAGFTPGFHLPSGPWNITDHPVYSWRAISLDTSRNFMPISVILRTLDGMSATKLNILHWHIVDATSFPIVSKTYPDLTDSAYDKLSIYTYEDVKQVITYAADRGIRVIPEFDSPSHAQAFSFSKVLKPFVLCRNAANGWRNPYNGGVGNQPDGSWFPTCVEPPCGAVNIANPDAGPAIAKLLVEYTGLFNDSVMHLGGDEVSSFCFASEPEFTSRVFPDVTNFAKLFPNATVPSIFPPDWYAGFTKSYQTYADQIVAAVKGTGKKTMHWEDIVLKDGVVLPADAVIQVWNGWDDVVGKNSLQKLLDLNRYQIVDSNNEVYYLDGGSGKWLTDSLGYGNSSWKEEYWIGYRNWQHIYNHDPRTSPMENTTDKTGFGLASQPTGNLTLILGASAAIWGEKIDSSNLDVKLWPRAAAMAEALWSSFDDPTNKDLFEAEPRLTVMRERLISRGLAAEALHPAWCNTHLCGFKFKGNKSPFGNVDGYEAGASKDQSSQSKATGIFTGLKWISSILIVFFMI
ncbi:glycoside hydrolase [Rhizoclosmatium globosum]|uniref:Beta-hexosaminidase n=1 Tax=Rhizoclosmatium globosum TaxID=329046 RepID=A0A1Y2CE93_9FUNG|nr:glycoside hydrolase [Rhizoclosmatium globosum]|eukprot:ORY45207.1 glycoside hydrolase [Rhizoclosmatium globosum]